MTEEQPAQGRFHTLVSAFNGRPADVAFAVLVAVGCLWIFWLGRSASFRVDDWVYVTERPPYSLDYLMVPHNEHWSFFMKLAFQLVFSVVGLRSYLPYLAVLLLAHGLTVLAVYAAVSAASGRVLSFAIGLGMLFLGYAHENLFWYSTSGLLEAIAAGAAATWLFLARPPTPRITLGVGILLVLSVMSGGDGLAFVAGIGATALVDKERRRAWWGPFGAGLVYLVWFIIWGRGAAGGPIDLAGVPAFIYAGAANGFGAATGLGRGMGFVVVPLLVGAVVVRMASGRLPSSAALVGVVGLITFLTLTGMVRGEGPLGADLAYAPRYITISAAFLALIVAGLLGRPSDLSAAVWRGVAISPLLVVALVVNGSTLIDDGHGYAEQAMDMRARVTVLEQYPTAAAVNASTGLPIEPHQLRALISEYGSPTTDEFHSALAWPIPADGMDRALFEVVSNSLSLSQSTGGAALGAVPPTLLQGSEVTVGAAGGCLAVKTLGPDAQVWLSVPSETKLGLRTDGWGDVGIYLGHDSPTFTEANALHQTILSDTSYLLAVPDMGNGFTWRVAIKLGVGIRSGSICNVAGTGA